MIASLLKYRIAIYQVTTAPDSTGDPVRTETLYKNAWSAVKYDAGTESTEAKQITAAVKARFQIRPDATITETMYISYNGYKYDIDYIETINRDTMFLHTTRINKK